MSKLSISVIQLKTELYKFDEIASNIISAINSNVGQVIVFHELTFGYCYDDLFLQPDLGTRGMQRIKDDSAALLIELTNIPKSTLCNTQINFTDVNNFYVNTLITLKKILDSGVTTGKLVILSCPIYHNKRLYNCNVFIANSTIVLVRPKTELANESHYHEPRHFSYYEYREASGKMKNLETLTFPESVGFSQSSVPFGIAILNVKIGETIVKIASEICEELWCEHPTIGNYFVANDVDILINTSSSYFEYGKLDVRMNLVKNASSNITYVYCNNSSEQSHNSTCMDGGSMVYENGKLLALMNQFSTNLLEVETVTINPTQFREDRRRMHSYLDQPTFHQLDIHVTDISSNFPLTSIIESPSIMPNEVQCLYAMIMWLWGYYKFSKATFLFLPLSGGLDSGLTSAIVFGMCKIVLAEAFKNRNMEILNVIIPRLLNTNYNDPSCKLLNNVMSVYTNDGIMKTDNNEYQNLSCMSSQEIHELAQQICSKIHITAYLASDNSGKETYLRAHELAKSIGATFISEFISKEYDTFVSSSEYVPEFGRFPSEDIALECLQARLRMVKIYKMCQLYAVTTMGYSKKSFGLVLAASNSSELFVGYWTKYDAGSGDLCLIGGCSKQLVKKLSVIAVDLFGISALLPIVEAIPTAELKPSTELQTDEGDMGFTYEMCDKFSSLTCSSHLDFVDIFNVMIQMYDLNKKIIPIDKKEFIIVLVEKLKKYIWRCFANIHKRIISTQSLHIERADPDYKRACLIPNNIDPLLLINELVKNSNKLVGIIDDI